MSNAKGNREQSTKIDQSPQQLSPREALPTDFVIGKPLQTSNLPGHGQRGNSEAEEKQLLSEVNGIKSDFPTPNKNVTGTKKK